MVEMVKLLQATILCALVLQCYATAFPASVCSTSPTAVPQGTCTYIPSGSLLAPATRNCCDRTEITIDTTACSLACRKLYVELLCKTSCQYSLNTGAGLCESAAIQFYQSCSTCTPLGFPVPNLPASATQTEAARAYFNRAPLNYAVNTAATCFNPFLSSPPTLEVLCAATSTQPATGISVSIPTPINLNAITNPTLVTVTADITQANGCATTRPPLYGYWNVTLNGVPLAVNPAKLIQSFEFGTGATTYTASGKFQLTPFALKAGATAQLVITFTTVNLAGTASFARTVNVVQEASPTLPATVIPANAAWCSTDPAYPLLLGVDVPATNVGIGAGPNFFPLIDAGLPAVVVDTPTGCSLTGTNPDRTKVELGKGTNPNWEIKGRAGLRTAPGTTCPLPTESLAARAGAAQATNINFANSAGGFKLSFLDCVNFANVITSGGTLILEKSTLPKYAAVLYLDAQTALSFTSMQPATLPAAVDPTTAVLVLRGAGSFTSSGTGTTVVALSARERTTVYLTADTIDIRTLEVTDNAAVVIKTAPAPATVVDCTNAASTTKIASGRFDIQFVDKSHLVTFKGCTAAKWSIGGAVTGRKLQNQDVVNCQPLVQTGCSTASPGITYPLNTASATACLVIGSQSNDQDTCRGVTVTIPAVGTDTGNVKLNYIAQNGYTLAATPGNGPLSVAANSRVFFFNVNPQFGALRTQLAVGENNVFGAGSTFEVTVSANIDKSNTVYIPLVICDTISAAVTLVSSQCTGTGTLPKIVVTNKGNREVDLTYFGPGGTPLSNSLFPGLFSDAPLTTTLASQRVGIIALVLRPVPVSTPVAVTPQFQSDFYTVYLNQNLATYTQDQFTADVLSATGLQASFFAITSFGTDPANAAQIRVVFFCRDLASTQSADATCQRLQNNLLTEPVLNGKTRAVASGGTTSRNTQGGDTSNGALFALFALALIPILLIFAIILFVCNKRRAADNQYSQDTSTFSTVAGQPYPDDKYYPSTPASYE